MNAPAVPERNPAAQPAPDPYHVYLDALQSPESKRTMRGCLDRIARLITGDPDATGAGQPWELLRYEHTVRLRTLMREQGWSPAHVNKHLVALRRVLKEAWRLGLMTGEDFQRAADLPAYKHTRVPVGQHVQPEALAATLAVCDDDHSPAGRRDGAMLAALYSTGCRRAEIAGLTLADLDSRARSLRVRGKGDKERLVYLTAEAVERLELWLSARGRVAGPLFCPINKAGRLRLSHMTGQAIADIVSRRLASAGASRRTPHDFRRTFIGELLDAGVDLATTQALVGHASPATTARYDRRPERRRREAVDRLRMPATQRPRDQPR